MAETTGCPAFAGHDKDNGSDFPSFRRSHRCATRRRQDVSERHGGAGRPRSRRARRRVPVAARPVGLRQIDGVADHRRADRADPGRRRMDSRGQDRKRESIGLCVPGADTDAVGQRVQQRAAAAQAQGRRIGAGIEARRRRARSCRLAKIRRRLSARIVRRHAHAGLDRACAGHRAGAAVDGRAVRGARRDHPLQAQQRSACRSGRRCAPQWCSSPIRSSSRFICRAASW